MHKKYNDGEWTEARFRQFILNGLRHLSGKWPPKHKVRKEAWIERGTYWCAGYKRRRHKVNSTLPPKPGNKKRINNAQIDHIVPVISPEEGFVDWNQVIERLFCDSDGLQVLCNECHQKKTNDERKVRNDLH